MAWAIFFAAIATASALLHMENLAIAAGLVAIAIGWRPLVHTITDHEWKHLGHAWKRRPGI